MFNSDSTSFQVDTQFIHKERGHKFDSIIRSPPFLVDTVLHQFHLLYKMQDNDGVVLSVERAGKSLISNKEIRKQDFDSIIPREFFDKVQLHTGFIWEHNDENIVILINICVPDTDLCIPILLSIDSLGRFFAKEEMLNDME